MFRLTLWDPGVTGLGTLLIKAYYGSSDCWFKECRINQGLGGPWAQGQKRPKRCTLWDCRG